MTPCGVGSPVTLVFARSVTGTAGRLIRVPYDDFLRALSPTNRAWLRCQPPARQRELAAEWARRTSLGAALGSVCRMALPDTPEQAADRIAERVQADSATDTR